MNLNIFERSETIFHGINQIYSERAGAVGRNSCIANICILCIVGDSARMAVDVVVNDR